MKPEEIAALPPSMQKRYEDSKAAYLVPDNRIFIAPVSLGHIFAKSRKDAMRAFVVRGSGNSLPEEESDGVPKAYQVFIVKPDFPTLDELSAPVIAPIQQTSPQVTQPVIAPPTPVAAPVDNA